MSNLTYKWDYWNVWKFYFIIIHSHWRMFINFFLREREREREKH